MKYNIKYIEYPNGEMDIRIYLNPIEGKPKNEPSEEENEWQEGKVPDKEKCLRVSRNRSINKVYEYARCNSWDYFLTFTFDKKKIDRYNYDEITQKLSKWFNNTRRKYSPDLKYLLVPELHKDGAFHFHALVSNIGKLPLKRAKNPHNNTELATDKGIPIFNLTSYKLGYSTATPVTDTKKVSNYITKYITKELCAVTDGKKRYWASKNLDKPKEYTDFFTNPQKEKLKVNIEKTSFYHKEKEVKYTGYSNFVDYYTINQSDN